MLYAGSALAFGAYLGGGVAASALSLTSPDIKPGARIADEQAFDRLGCSGKNVSPALSWSGAPKGTRSFAVTVLDPDAPTGGGFWHWVLFDIPADTTSLGKGAGDPGGAAAPKGGVAVKNDFGSVGYGGPCPPKGARHHYVFTLYALDVDRLDADENASPAAVGSDLRSHTLAKATFTALYGH